MACLAALLSVVVATPVEAFVPQSEKIASAVARGNLRAKRGQTLSIEVTLRIGAGDPVARGTLLSDPRGLARLELRDASGAVERHLLQGNSYQAARGSRMLSSPRRYLPPLFFLQARNGDRLRSAVLSLGAASPEAVLGRLDGQVCYVMGGRELAPPANLSAAEVPGTGGPTASVWVDRGSFQVLRIDLLGGAQIRFGPAKSQAGIALPAWIDLEEPGQPAARLELGAATAVKPNLSQAFGTDWLLGR